MSFALAPLAEQRRIADILDEADALRKKRREALVLTDELLRATFLEMFGDPVANPKGWPRRTIGSICSERGVVIGPFGSDLKASDYRRAGHPVIFVRDIASGRFQYKSDVFVDAAKFDQLAAHVAQAGDIVVTKMGDPPGIAAIVPNGSAPSVITADVLRVSPNREIVDPAFLAFELNIGVAEQVRSITAGITRAKVTLRDYREIRVRVPPPEVQAQFTRQYELSSKQRAEQQTNEQQLDALFASLQHRAFRGEL
jgi:type I restriction enzyme S subunit